MDITSNDLRIDNQISSSEKFSKVENVDRNVEIQQSSKEEKISQQQQQQQQPQDQQQTMSKNQLKRLKRKLEHDEEEKKLMQKFASNNPNIFKNNNNNSENQDDQQISKRQLKKLKRAEKEKEQNNNNQKQTNINKKQQSKNEKNENNDNNNNNNNNDNNNNNNDLDSMEQNSNEIENNDEELETNISTNDLITASMLSETTFYISQNLRFVKPYYLDFTTWTKRRWIGRKLIDVFCQEFGGTYDRFYFEQKIKNGGIQVDSKSVDLDFILQDHQLISHKVHRHEPPVISLIPKIIMENENMIVVEKPSSIPTHPTGRYRHNTLLFLLAHFHNKLNLFPINRLDKLTSGIMILAKNSSTAAQLSSFLKRSTMQKEYLAMVSGKFPNDKEIIDVDK